MPCEAPLTLGLDNKGLDPVLGDDEIGIIDFMIEVRRRPVQDFGEQVF